MRKLAILTAVTALAVIGLVSPGRAYHTNYVVDACGDASPEGVDIDALSVASDEVNVTVMMLLCAAPISDAKYRIHLDYEGDIASDGNKSCGTTSDHIAIYAVGPNGPQYAGPGTFRISGRGIVYTVPYKDLGLLTGDEVEFWTDTDRTGIADRAPNTDGGEGCSEPQSLDEVVGIELY